MKVKEVIEILKQCDPEAEAVYAIDDEGNAFHIVSSCGLEGIFVDEENEFLDIDSMKEYGYSEEDGIRAVCIN